MAGLVERYYLLRSPAQAFWTSAFTAQRLERRSDGVLDALAACP